MDKDKDFLEEDRKIILSQKQQVENFKKIMRLVTIALIAFAIIMVIFAGITISNLIISQINQDRIASLESNFVKLYKIFVGTLEEYKPDRDAQNKSRSVIFHNNELNEDQNRTLAELMPIIKEINKTLVEFANSQR